VRAHPDDMSHKFGTFAAGSTYQVSQSGGTHMDGLIYLVGLVVIVLAILSFFGLR
jgi:hypothetical protein